MRPAVYIETTIPSYLTARPSRDIVFMANQQITREWWDRRRVDFDLFVSQFVLDEAEVGDPDAAARRLEILRDLPVLEVDESCRHLALALLDGVPLPPKAKTDALHIAVAAANGVDYLLTWNCAHLANAALRSRIESICEACGVAPPAICTPQELM